MNRVVAYPAPIPVGHVVEVTEYADTRPEPFRAPVALNDNGGNTFRVNSYPLTPRASLTVSRTWTGVVTACSIFMVEGCRVSTPR